MLIFVFSRKPLARGELLARAEVFRPIFVTLELKQNQFRKKKEIISLVVN
uniref:Uncharacterized protein n=1 Tax=Lepeophtheirus salmonis TaxID=72036 RepID=A0A0K2TVV6_LEPSM